MNINIKLAHPGAKMPTYATDGSGCFDLYAAEAVGQGLYDTGVAFEVPEGYALMVYSRSGDGFNRGLSLVNSVGVIDSDYRGTVKVKFSGSHNEWFPSHAIGDRIAQAMVIPVPRVSFTEVDSLTATSRGAGGFGSTGK